MNGSTIQGNWNGIRASITDAFLYVKGSSNKKEGFLN